MIYLDQYSILRQKNAQNKPKPLSYEQVSNLAPEELEMDQDLTDALLFSKKILKRLSNRQARRVDEIKDLK